MTVLRRGDTQSSVVDRDVTPEHLAMVQWEERCRRIVSTRFPKPYPASSACLGPPGAGRLVMLAQSTDAGRTSGERG